MTGQRPAVYSFPQRANSKTQILAKILIGEPNNLHIMRWGTRGSNNMCSFNLRELLVEVILKEFSGRDAL